MKDVLKAQDEARKQHELFEKKLIEREERRDKREAERDKQFMDSMAMTMSMLMQFLGGALYCFPPPSPASPPYTPNTASMPFQMGPAFSWPPIFPSTGGIPGPSTSITPPSGNVITEDSDDEEEG